MNKTTAKKWPWILIGMGMVCICLVTIGLAAAWWMNRNKPLTDRPLVWFTTPTSHQVFKAGEPISVQALVRSASQITRLELWIDSEFIREIRVEEGQSAPATGLTYLWNDPPVGTHSLAARAFTVDGTRGTATVRMDVVSNKAEETIHEVAEGETVESIAEQAGMAPEDLLAANPEAAADGISAGDELDVSGGDSSDPGAPAGDGSPSAPAETDETAPEPYPADEPSGFPGSLFFFMERFPLTDSAQQVPLRIELTGLVTMGSYESMHCYIGATGSTPGWYPNADNDPSTDESFVNTPGWGWNISDYYAGTRAPVILWQEDQPLSLEVNCVGVAAGGTDAVMAGHLTLSIPPEEWDGNTRWARSERQEDEFMLQYLVGHTTRDGRGIPIELDQSLRPPINLVLEDGFLRWEYTPTDADEPIDGFLIYFNDSVIWTVPSDSRSLQLPAVWLRPTCGSVYNFSVGTVIGVYPDSRESPQSNVVSIETPREDCRRQVRITFLQIETFTMPGDGHHEDRTGDVGPIYGQFFANAHSVSFDTGMLGPGLDVAEGWTSNTVYDLVDEQADGNWNFTGRPELYVNIGEHDHFQYAFGIMDEDSGRCHDSDDPGCDDMVCSGLSTYLESESQLAELDYPHEESLRSDNGLCLLTVRIEPTGEGAVGSTGELPLPSIHPTNLSYDEETGEADITFENSGTAAWPNQDLEISVTDRDNFRYHEETLDHYNIAPGAEASVQMPLPEGIDDYCVVFDPNNLVPEVGELNGAYATYHPVCRSRPDLSVEGIRYNRETSNLEVNISNSEYGEIVGRTIEIEIAISGESQSLLITQPDFTLEGNSATTLNIPLTNAQRTQMTQAASEDGIGYVLTLNPNHTIGETDYDNNSFEVAEARGFAVGWAGGCSEAVVWGLRNHFTMSFSGSVEGDHIFSWNSPEHTVYFNTVNSEENTVCWGLEQHDVEREPAFTIMGDELLYLRVVNNVDAGAEEYHVGTWEYYMDPNQEMDYIEVDANYYCNLDGWLSAQDGVYNVEVYYPGEHDGRPNPGTWYTQIHICRVLR